MMFGMNLYYISPYFRLVNFFSLKHKLKKPGTLPNDCYELRLTVCSRAHSQPCE